MIGDVTDGEEKNQDEEQLQASLFQNLVSGVCVAEEDDHMSVTAQHDEQRDTKSSHRPSNAVFQVTLNTLRIGGIKAFLRFVHIIFRVKRVWKTLNTHQQPNHG